MKSYLDNILIAFVFSIFVYALSLYVFKDSLGARIISSVVFFTTPLFLRLSELERKLKRLGLKL